MKFTDARHSHPQMPAGRRQYTTLAALGRYLFPEISGNRQRVRAAMVLLIRAGFIELSSIHISERRVSAGFSLHAKATRGIVQSAEAQSGKIAYDRLSSISSRECLRILKGRKKDDGFPPDTA